jgi:prepilin-type N-terminal cleavage/methylation domain-containing protein
MRRSVRQKAKGGFTFIEVIVVIVLIALFAGAVGGAYSGPYKSMMLKKAARDVLLAAKYARGTAVEQQKICRLSIDAVNRTVMVTVESWDEENSETVASETKNAYWKTVTLGGDAQFELVAVDKSDVDAGETSESEGQYSVRFMPDGTAENTVIQVGDGARHYVVMVSEATGLARVEEGAATEFKSDTIDLEQTASGTGTK